MGEGVIPVRQGNRQTLLKLPNDADISMAATNNNESNALLNQIVHVREPAKNESAIVVKCSK